MAHRKVDLLAREIHVMQRSRNTQIDLRVRLGKVAEAVHKPFGGEIRRGADGENARALPLNEPLGACGNAIQRIADHREIVSACLRDEETLAFAIEQLDG